MGDLDTGSDGESRAKEGENNKPEWKVEGRERIEPEWKEEGKERVSLSLARGKKEGKETSTGHGLYR